MFLRQNTLKAQIDLICFYDLLNFVKFSTLKATLNFLMVCIWLNDIVLYTFDYLKCLLIMVGTLKRKYMRLRVVSERTEIPNLNPNEKMVHMAFRASNVDFLNLMQRCPRLRMIQVPPSYRKTMSNAIQVFLDMQGIELLQGDVWGHRKDLDEYFNIEDATIEESAPLLPVVPAWMM